MAAAMEDRSSDCRRLSDDIIGEILLRLPVKTLKRFSCVCKSWLSLISSPQFHKHHFKLAQQRPPLLLALKDESLALEDQSLDYKPLPLYFSAYTKSADGTLTLVNEFPKAGEHCRCIPFIKAVRMQSCEGLVCIFSGIFNDPTLICNPSTQNLIPLPLSEHYSPCIGLGYAALTEEFKVVRFSGGGRNFKNGCEVFTLGTNGWREVTSPPYAVFQGAPSFLHGALHFLRRIELDGGVKDTDYIGVFDLETEEYREGIRLPSYYYGLGDCEGRGIIGSKDFLRLSNLRGALCLTLDFWEHRQSLELWLLKDYKRAGWIKGYTINFCGDYNRWGAWAYPVDYMVDEIILLNCCSDEGVELVGYNPEDGTVTQKKDNRWAATSYVETFYPLPESV